MCSCRPIILLNVGGFYNSTMQVLNDMKASGLLYKDPLELVTWVTYLLNAFIDSGVSGLLRLLFLLLWLAFARIRGLFVKAPM
jgi:hypothetical protein